MYDEDVQDIAESLARLSNADTLESVDNIAPALDNIASSLGSIAETLESIDRHLVEVIDRGPAR